MIRLLNNNNKNERNSSEGNYLSSEMSDEEQVVFNRYKEMQQAMVDKDIDKLNDFR